MTLATLFVLTGAVLTTLMLGAWVWFAIRHASSAMFSLGDLEDVHFERPVAGARATPGRQKQR